MHIYYPSELVADFDLCLLSFSSLSTPLIGILLSFQHEAFKENPLSQRKETVLKSLDVFDEMILSLTTSPTCFLNHTINI